MSDQLIPIPLKTSTEIDFTNVFLKYFTKVIGYKDKNKIREAAGQLTALRTSATARNSITGKTRTEDGLQIVCRYADSIGFFTSKIQTEHFNKDANIKFIWDDALDRGMMFIGTKSTTTQSNLTFEVACALFNVAAMQSQFASAQKYNESDNVDEQLVMGAKLFQNAASIFHHISCNLIGLSVPAINLTSDLQPPVLICLSSLMLAQAQELLIKKAIQDQMAASTLAKACLQASEMYSELLESFLREEAEGRVKYGWDSSWINLIKNNKIPLYLGLAQYFQAAAAIEMKKIGEQICRLELAIKYFKKAQEQLGKFKNNNGSCTTYLVEASRLLSVAKKDNDFIYHDVIPEYGLLPMIDKVSSARLAKLISPIPAYFSTNTFVDIFAELQFEPKETPLKLAFDASVHAAGFYLNKLHSTINNKFK